jgi:hypothetical protein
MNRSNAPQPIMRQCNPKLILPEVDDTYYESLNRQKLAQQNIMRRQQQTQISASLFEAPRNEVPMQIAKENQPLLVENIQQTIIQTNNYIMIAGDSGVRTPTSSEATPTSALDIQQEEKYLLQLQKRLLYMHECLNDLKTYNTVEQMNKYGRSKDVFREFVVADGQKPDVQQQQPLTERRESNENKQLIAPSFHVSRDNSNVAWNFLAAKYLNATPNGVDNSFDVLHDISKNQPKLL